MKKHLVLFILTLSILACDVTDPLFDPFTPELLGEWELSAVLADPGDGSGTYNPVDSDKTIEFFEEGYFEASQNMCTSGDSGEPSNVGTYSLADSSLTVTNCSYGASQEALKLYFSIEEGDLYISFPCIEPCGEKYVRKTGN